MGAVHGSPRHGGPRLRQAGCGWIDRRLEHGLFRRPGRRCRGCVRVPEDSQRYRHTQIGLLGVSQAGWIMPLAAVRSKDLAFLISISGAGVPAAETTIDQARNEMAMTRHAARDPRAIMTVLKLQYQFARTGQGWDEYAAAREKLAARLGKPPDTIPGTPDHPHWDVIRRSYFYDPYRPFVGSKCRRSGYGESWTTTSWRKRTRPPGRQRSRPVGTADYTLRILAKANHAQWEAKIGSNAEMESLDRFVPAYFTAIPDWLAKRIRRLTIHRSRTCPAPSPEP